MHAHDPTFNFDNKGINDKIYVELRVFYIIFITNTAMSLMQVNHLSRHRLGFSLLEMLTTIAIIGIIVAIAIPFVGKTNYYEAARDRRNAQEIASICAAAQAAGLNFVVEGDLEATVNNIIRGGTVQTGSFSGRWFGVPNMDAVNAGAAVRYLRLEGNSLVYAAYSVSSPIVQGSIRVPSFSRIRCARLC